MKEKRHWSQIDLLYTLGIVLVLIGHSHSSDWSAFSGTILHRAILFIYTFHMPLFFFVAGFLFQNSDSLERLGYGRWIGDKALRLLTPYLFWTLLALVPKYYLEHHGLSGLTPLYALRTVLIPRQNIWGHFWFIPVMFLTYALFGAVCSLARSVQRKALPAVLAAVSLGIYFLPVRTALFGLADLKSVLVFFALGMAFRAYFPAERLSAVLHNGPAKERPGANPYSDRQSLARHSGSARLTAWGAVLIGTFWAIVLWRSAGDRPPAALLIVLMMFSVCWLLSELLPHTPASKWLAAHNFSVYIFSWFFQAAVMIVCDKLRLSWIMTFFCMFFIGLAGPVVLIALCERLPLMQKRFFRLVLGLRQAPGRF